LKRILFAAAAALLPVAGASSAAPTAHSPLDALDKAKTIQVTETMMAPSETGPIHAVATLKIKVQQSGQARIEQSRPGAATADAVLVTDGKTLTEYIAARKQYRKGDSPPLSQFGYDGLPALRPYPAAAKFVATSLTGKPALLYTIIEKANDQSLTGQSLTRKLWVDASSRLPLRQSIFTGTGAKAKEVLRTMFANWELDKPLQTTVFAFNPPVGVTEYKEPVMPVMPPSVSVTSPDASPTAPATPDAPAAPSSAAPVVPPAPAASPTDTPAAPPQDVPASPPAATPAMPSQDAPAAPPK
jgi:outer membrane lipoprotein-sorting protein